jgi:hypothetical protein
MKDISFILDNFPIDEIIHIEEPIKTETTKKNFFHNNGIFKSVQSQYEKSTKSN